MDRSIYVMCVLIIFELLILLYIAMTRQNEPNFDDAVINLCADVNELERRLLFEFEEE